MIRINLIGILALLLFACAVVCGYPVWIALAELAWHYPAARWFAAGVLTGCCLPLAIGWNAALRLRREQMIDRADEEYQRDRKRIL